MDAPTRDALNLIRQAMARASSVAAIGWLQDAGDHLTGRPVPEYPASAVWPNPYEKDDN